MPDRQEISLLDSLGGEWVKLPLAVMRDCGPAAQALGGLLRMTNRETFSPVYDIASKARLPVGTTRPTKTSDTRATNFKGESVELDAIPPSTLRGIMDRLQKGQK